jgi:Mg2+-importing ATPase
MMNLNILTETFANFVRSHGMERHFRRLVILDMFLGTPAAKDISQSLASTLMEASEAEPAFLLKKLGSRLDGLTEAESDHIRETSGFNEVAHEKPVPWWNHLWHCYWNPFNLLLSALALISYLTEDMRATIVIGLMVLLSTGMRFVQEQRSNKAADKLKEMVSNTATIMRHDIVEDVLDEARKYFDVVLHPKGPRVEEVPIKLLVPGDIVRLSAGDMIPADLRVLSAKDLFISQAAMTGESMPVEKFTTDRGEKTHNPLELDNICFMGTNVVSGSANAVVVGTGNRTYFGTLAERVTAVDRRPTAFQSGVNKVSWLLIRFMMFMTPTVFLLNGFTKGNWLEAFLFALSIAVGLTPEMLPMIVTSTLAKGAVMLSRKKVIVKRLDAIQNFGAMDVLCTDKTGTLTQDKIFLERHTDIFGEESDHVWDYAYLNSFYQTGLKNLLDVAVLNYAEDHEHLQTSKNYTKVDEIPFDFQRRRMSVVVRKGDDNHVLICKGAVEEILSICTRVQHGDVIEPLTPELLSRVKAVTASLNEEGLRVVAVAAKDSTSLKESYGVADEQDMTLIGYIAFLDPPKESTAPALEALRAHGIDVKILTGDNELVTDQDLPRGRLRPIERYAARFGR